MLHQKKIIVVLIFFMVTVVIPVYLYAQDPMKRQVSDVVTPNNLSSSIPIGNNSFNNGINNCNDNSGTKYYLLKTNYIIEGNAKFDGKTYDIKTNYGSVRIPLQNIAFIGQSREEIYRYKKTQLNPLGRTDLLKFAEWCVANSLLQEAILEYENALQVAGDNVTTDIIRQRIITLKKNIAEINNVDQVASNTVNNFSKGEIDGSFITDSDIKYGNNHIKAAKNLADNFKRHVQPILMKNCVHADCHGISKGNPQKFILTHNVPTESGTVNSLQNNLNACLLYIDLESPMRSSLLNFFIVPHAKYTPPFNVESDEYNKVVAWVQLAAKNLPLIKVSDLAKLFSDPQPILTSEVITSEYIASDPNKTVPSVKFEMVNPKVTTNLPASFQEVVDLQNQANNNRMYSNNNVTKNHSAIPRSTQPTTSPANQTSFPMPAKINNDVTVSTTSNENIFNLVNIDENDIDRTDPMIFNKMYHPNIVR
ncbi:MAG: hypothetical protein LBC74_15995 [Planctomycetaceae bacterium]|jgi:hypothetical protein|nr:hypothetical protein [Planctomycetaceae bacterium]